MDTTACVAAPALSSATLLALVPITLTALAWGAREVVRRRQAERERSAAVIRRLLQYRVSHLAAELAAQPLVPVPLEESPVGRALIRVA